MRTPQPKDEFAEVLVCGHENCFIAIGLCKDRFVGYPRFQFPYAYDGVTITTQTIYHSGIHALVDEKVHAGAPVVGYTTSARKVFAA